MPEENTREFANLQQQLRTRLEEFGFADGTATSRLSHHLAEIAVMGRQLSEQVIPLFLTVDPDNSKMLLSLTTAMKCDIEQLGDAVTDVHEDMLSLMSFFDTRTSS